MGHPTVALNENAPDGGDYKREGDNEIRIHKKQVREIVGTDHKYDSSGQDNDMGKHNQVSLLEQDGTGLTGATGLPILYAKTISGKPELVYRNEGNTDVQITSEDALLGATTASIIAVIYPVGALYFTEKNENPGTTLGIGTWAAYAVGTTLVGYKAADGDFNTIGGAGGEKTHTLSVAEIPNHEHEYIKGNDTGPGTADGVSGNPHRNSGNSTPDSESVGGGGAHNNLPPYTVAYIWKRTA